MIVERGICERLLDVFSAITPDLDVDCSWLSCDDLITNHRPRETGKMEIRLSTRNYSSFTSRTADFSGSLTITFALENESDISRTNEACDEIVRKFEAWHSDIEEVKDDLSVNDYNQKAFTPAGFRTEGGEFDIDRENKTGTIMQKFTLRGIVTRPNRPNQTTNQTTNETP